MSAGDDCALNEPKHNCLHRASARVGSDALSTVCFVVALAIIGKYARAGLSGFGVIAITILACAAAVFLEGRLSTIRLRLRIARLLDGRTAAAPVDLWSAIAEALDRCSATSCFKPFGHRTKSPLELAAIAIARVGRVGHALLLATDPAILPKCEVVPEEAFEPMRVNQNDAGFIFVSKPRSFREKFTYEFQKNRPWARAAARVLLPLMLIGAVIWFYHVIVATILSFNLQVVLEWSYWGAFVLVIVLWKSHQTQEWYAIPGGVVVRRSGVLSSKWRVSLARRDESAIVYWQDLDAIAVSTVDGQSFSRNVTEAEAELIITAWLSPLEPPPLEQLSDLI